MTIESQPSTLLYAVDERPPFWTSVFLGIQHVLLIFSGIVIVPVIVARGSDVPPEQIEFVAFAAIIVSSISTLIQVLRFGPIGSGYVLFMGTSGAFIACSLAAVKLGGFALVGTMCLLAAPLMFLFSYLLRFARNILTPAVGGVVIMLVSVNLIPITMQLWTGYPGTPHYCSWANLIVGLITLLTILLMGAFGGPRIRVWAPILGMVAGYLAAWHWGILEPAHFRQASLWGLPRGHWPGIFTGIGVEHLPLLLTFCVTTVVGTIESVGTAMAVQRVSHRHFRKIDYKSIQGCLYSDGIGHLLVGLAGTVPNTTYSSTIPVIQLTGVSSRQVGLYGAVFLGLLAFFPKVGAVVLDIPGPVLGGSMVVFLGMLFATGMDLATSTRLNYQSSLIAGLSLCVGIFMENKLFFHDAIPAVLEPFLGNGIATGCVTALLLTLMFRLRPRARSSLRLAADEGNLKTLNDFTAELQKPMRLTDSQLFSLQLACEEVFLYICRSEPQLGNGRMVRFRWADEGAYLQTEIETRSELDDLTAPRVPADLKQAEAEELSQLGLVILSKIAREVTHMQISGNNYISFKIEAGAGPR